MVRLMPKRGTAYVDHTEDDRHFHLVGISKDKRVIRPMPTGI